MPTPKKRRKVVWASTAVLAVAGAVCGYFLALRIAESVTVAQLENQARQLLAESDFRRAEIRTALAAIDASPSSACDDAEIKYLSALIFQSDFLKDAGRMQAGGRIECSAALGHVAHPWPQTQPDAVLQNGVAIYSRLTPYLDNDFPTIAVQRGRSFVAFVPFTGVQMQPASIHAIETVETLDQKRLSLLGDPLPDGFSIPTASRILRVKKNLYVSRCSVRSSLCVTAYTSIDDTVAAHRTRFNGCIALCGVLGANLSFLLSLLYRRNKSLERQLRRAIRKDQLRVVYQPIVELSSRRILGAEALARWTDEEGNAVAPDVFIALAEKKGFVREITWLVLRHVLRELGPLLRNRADLRVSINVTAADLADRGFLDFLALSLAVAGVAPQSIAIEITESSTVQYDVAIQAIRALRKRGHCVHIDDFGTGYSSLAYLHELSVDAIKIDRAFTQSIGTGSATTAILPPILAMAEALHLNVVVEGIETEQQAAYFIERKKPVFAQGWLFGRPASAQEFCLKLAVCDRRPPVAEPMGRRRIASVA